MFDLVPVHHRQEPEVRPILEPPPFLLRGPSGQLILSTARQVCRNRVGEKTWPGIGVLYPAGRPTRSPPDLDVRSGTGRAGNRRFCEVYAAPCPAQNPMETVGSLALRLFPIGFREGRGRLANEN